jgi:D-alanine-D-alanine ligase
MRIGVTYDLKDDYLELGFAEHEVAEFDSVETIDALCGALESLRHECDRIGNVRALAERLVAGDRWDLVFNICEGVAGYGRESQVPALLEAYGIPYTFSDPLVCALTLHKGMAKHVARGNGIATPDFAVVAERAEAEQLALEFPLFVKPVAEGTSKGVTNASVVRNRSALLRRCEALWAEYRQPVLIERFLPGREFTVGVIGTGAAAGALGTLEVLLNPDADAHIYSYRNKAQWQELVDYRLLSAGDLRSQVEALALATWRCLGCRDAGRVDVRLDEHGVPQMLEVNPLAGLTPGHSDLPIMAALAGIEYTALIARILAAVEARLAEDSRAADAA